MGKTIQAISGMPRAMGSTLPKTHFASPVHGLFGPTVERKTIKNVKSVGD
jgi:hypothetical protein